MFFENSGEPYKLIAQKTQSAEKIFVENTWNALNKKYNER